MYLLFLWYHCGGRPVTSLSIMNRRGGAAGGEGNAVRLAISMNCHRPANRRNIATSVGKTYPVLQLGHGKYSHYSFILLMAVLVDEYFRGERTNLDYLVCRYPTGMAVWMDQGLWTATSSTHYHPHPQLVNWLGRWMFFDSMTILLGGSNPLGHILKRQYADDVERVRRMYRAILVADGKLQKMGIVTEVSDVVVDVVFGDYCGDNDDDNCDDDKTDTESSLSAAEDLLVLANKAGYYYL
jgi:hypothetical protein